MSIVLICGPVRSGKSRLAEGLAAASGLPVIYLATGPKPDPETDPEWAERVQQHRQRRPSSWQTWETGRDLGAELQKLPQPCCALVDSLGGWVAQGLDCPSSEWDPLVQSFLATLQSHRGEILLVSEEVGWGVVPAYPLGRRFRDRMGELTQRLAPLADQVFLVTAGFALDLTRLGIPVASKTEQS
ncbi:bifunctional adenosylcobinamide kinase/adenosylcobinamide-phosphate guanylyltransferase [Synechococcus sp. R8-2]|jgi:adenosylcobinamide kinase/adenosylcobinamide-phosphate guanylyltransferase|uniref:bifunctional adenosylcobinamide kinase/adenosylcobinamide-phosphate guanylyltransferase n=2 Tax=Synechococcus TaxID=1129 RepID=UPI0039C2C287